MKFIEDFKKFAFKGNVIDMAVGVVVGGAFSKIVTSLVGDVFMPLLGKVTAGVDFKELKWVITPAVMDGETVVTPETAVLYGAFIQNIIDFLLVALCVFLFVSLITRARERKKAKEAPPAPPAPPKPTLDQELLTEIRDLLKNK